MAHAATMLHQKSFSTSLANSDLYGTLDDLHRILPVLPQTSNMQYSQIRQGMANNTKGTAFVVYEDVMDAKQACDKLNGFNFQNRYLVGTWKRYS